MLLLAIVVPMVAYVIFCTSWAQNRIREIAQTELSSMLGTPVEIGRIDYKPFNTITISSVAVNDSVGNKVAGIGKVSARFEFIYFLRTKRFLFDYAVIDVPEINVWRSTPDSPLNVQPILDRFKRKDNQTPSATFDLKIGTIILRDGKIKYNVLSEKVTPGRFNIHHISLSDFNLHAYLRHASNDELDAMIESMSFKELSGLELSDLIVDLMVGDEGTALRELELELPGSKLSLQPIFLNSKGLSEIADTIRAYGITVSTAETAILSSRDFSAFLPVLDAINVTANVDFSVFASEKEIDVNEFRLLSDDGISADISAKISDFSKGKDKNFAVEFKPVESSGKAMANVIEKFNKKIAGIVSRTKSLSVRGTVTGNGNVANGQLEIGVDDGRIKTGIKANMQDNFKISKIHANAAISGVGIGEIIGVASLGKLTATLDGSLTIKNHIPEGSGMINVESFGWEGHTYKDINIQGEYVEGNTNLNIECKDPSALFALDAELSDSEDNKHISLDLDVEKFVPSSLNLPSWRKGFSVSGKLVTNLWGADINDIYGSLDLSDIRLKDETGYLNLREFHAEMQREDMNDVFEVRSDFINGTIEGEINPISLPMIFKNMAAHIVPNLLPVDESIYERLASESLDNRFTADFTLDNLVPVCNYLKLPVTVIYAVDILATVDSKTGVANISVDVPYLKQGDKIIDSTVIASHIDTSNDRMTIYTTSHMPTKKGPMTLVLGVTGAENRFDTRIDWEIERAIPLNGLIDFSTALGRTESGDISVDARFNPGQINFGDDVWNIHPSSFLWQDKVLAVNNFKLTADSQEINIDGQGSEDEDDIINIFLKNINLISIFETLEIENAMIGGKATGNFTASSVFSKIPVLTTENLHVDSISYNHCIIGNADVIAKWDNEKQSFFLDADIYNPEGQLSEIRGDIFPTEERLDLSFYAKHIRVGFMQKFMEAFASEVSGYGSGYAHLFGTFHDIDMEGDIYADDLKVKIDFTNTVYSATDSVHITPGVIELKDIVLRDINGRTALLNGILTHQYFHLPEFNFQITDAHDFLCYNISEAMNPDWYGTIYGNGSASVVGRPGVVEIGANMSTAPGSIFTFVLSDRLEAEQFTFITFNDVTELTEEEKLAEEDTPKDVRDYIERMNQEMTDSPSDYNLDLRVDITPDAQIILVMDPVGGDRIRSYGTGDMRMTYNSTENDIRMYGTYTLERGDYNFTLQDIIIKDFIIDAGSSITFRGDPYSAQLNIEAAYQLNANLTDLDESFAMDKDLNRTNVPVQALLKVTGDMRQPDIAFDLRFPTLTSDTYRKVRSIISTDEMMNQQIIYLLALNRFYTPDYMDATRGNELFSVASSTIASQLSNMLGKLSDKWSIAPNLRSDRGDFRDVEVDVALSSRLLNNRLLLNGNLGYRDKSLNTNQFVGDFDIEYLLTPKGTWRLKGYSRYNDQNYYVRTAPTTQGVGIMFRRDFDTLFPRRKRMSVAPTDSVAVDSIVVNP